MILCMESVISGEVVAHFAVPPINDAPKNSRDSESRKKIMDPFKRFKVDKDHMSTRA